MFKVIIAIDGSLGAQSAVDFARDLLVGKETAVTLLHVIPQHIMWHEGGVVVTEPFDDMPAARAAAKRLLADSAQHLKDGGVGPALEEQLLAGDPADQILAYAAQAAADLIVVGRRGLNAVQRFLVGSVSTKIMTHAPCAVLVVPPKSAT